MTIIAYRKQLRDRLVRRGDNLTLAAFQRMLLAVEAARTHDALKQLDKKLKKSLSNPA